MSERKGVRRGAGCPRIAGLAGIVAPVDVEAVYQDRSSGLGSI
jgi:hypothetical protein